MNQWNELLNKTEDVQFNKKNHQTINKNHNDRWMMVNRGLIEPNWSLALIWIDSEQFKFKFKFWIRDWLDRITNNDNDSGLFENGKLEFMVRLNRHSLSRDNVKWFVTWIMCHMIRHMIRHKSIVRKDLILSHDNDSSHVIILHDRQWINNFLIR